MLKSQRERISQWGLPRTLGYYAFGVAADKIGCRLLDVFEYPLHSKAVHLPSTTTFSILHTMADWTPRDVELLTTHVSMSLLPLYPGFFAGGDKCAVARWQGTELSCVCWSHPTNDYPFAPGVASYLIQHCFTLPDQRGKGLYPQTLAFACSYLRQNVGLSARIFVDCSTFNYASKRGIVKAGFEPAGRTLRAHGKSWSWAFAHCPNSTQPDVVNAG
jgi:hypothetical protein